MGHTVRDGFEVFAVQKLDLITLELVVFLAAAAWLVWAWVVRVEDERSAPDQPQPIPQKDLPVVGRVTQEQVEDRRCNI